MSVCVCVCTSCVSGKERVCEIICVCFFLCEGSKKCVCVCVCVREKQRERQRQSGIERGTERECARLHLLFDPSPFLLSVVILRGLMTDILVLPVSLNV